MYIGRRREGAGSPQACRNAVSPEPALSTLVAAQITRDLVKGARDRGADLRGRRGEDRLACDEHEILGDHRGSMSKIDAHGLPKTPSGAIALHGTPRPAAGGDGEADHPEIAGEGPQREQSVATPHTITSNTGDVQRAPKSRRDHHLLRPTQATVRRLRPRRRRAASTRRPPVVLMRARNPCTRARRRVFG